MLKKRINRLRFAVVIGCQCHRVLRHDLARLSSQKAILLASAVLDNINHVLTWCLRHSAPVHFTTNHRTRWIFKSTTDQLARTTSRILILVQSLFATSHQYTTKAGVTMKPLTLSAITSTNSGSKDAHLCVSCMLYDSLLCLLEVKRNLVNLSRMHFAAKWHIKCAADDQN